MFQESCDSMASMSSGLGFPVSSRTRSIWFRVEVPGNMAFPTMSSPMMHPTDHISTALVYLVEPLYFDWDYKIRG